jgi:hypothetical protein
VRHGLTGEGGFQISNGFDFGDGFDSGCHAELLFDRGY